MKKIGDDFYISTSLSDIDFGYTYLFLKESWWGKEYEKEAFKKSIENSFTMGLFKNEKQVGFLRLITDYSSYSYLADFFINKELRGQGVGKRFMDEFLNHEQIIGIKRLSLSTSDKQGFYNSLGFNNLAHPQWQIEKRNT